MDPEDARLFADRFRDPVCARAGRDTYRTFLTREIPKRKESRDTTSDGADPCAVRYSVTAQSPCRWSSPETANADDYTLETVDATHFVVDERPDLVRRKLIALAEETARYLARADAKVHETRRFGHFCVSVSV